MAVAEFQATLVQEAQGLPTGRWEGEGVADENGDRKCQDNRTGSCKRPGRTQLKVRRIPI